MLFIVLSSRGVFVHPCVTKKEWMPIVFSAPYSCVWLVSLRLWDEKRARGKRFKCTRVDCVNLL